VVILGGVLFTLLPARKVRRNGLLLAAAADAQVLTGVLLLQVKRNRRTLLAVRAVVRMQRLAEATRRRRGLAGKKTAPPANKEEPEPPQHGIGAAEFWYQTYLEVVRQYAPTPEEENRRHLMFIFITNYVCFCAVAAHVGNSLDARWQLFYGHVRNWTRFMKRITAALEGMERSVSFLQNPVSVTQY
jgi:hypothetical protein